MKFKFAIATPKKEGSHIPLQDFLERVEPPKGTTVELEVLWENTLGLSQVYNKVLESTPPDIDFLCLVHDDWDCNDYRFYEKVMDSTFNVIGVVGGRAYYPLPNWEVQPFMWNRACNGMASGFVQHQTNDGMAVNSAFGPSPAQCVWLDGQCLILDKVARKSKLKFCEDFTFDFYDGQLCFDAWKLGLQVGTAPILCTHYSMGEGMMGHVDRYMESQRKFIHRNFSQTA